MQRVRIESLTDLVFGLALSIGALVLTLQDQQDTLDLMSNILWFVFSFLILISVWLNYSYIMSQITVETPSALLLNLVLLLCVSLEPFVLNVMVDEGNVDEVLETASSAYAIIVGTIMACLGAMLHRSMKVHLERGDREGAKDERKLRNSRIFYSAVFYLTLLPVFWDVQAAGYPLRFVVWYASPLIWMANVAAERARRHLRR